MFVDAVDPGQRALADARWHRHGARLVDTLHALYGAHPGWSALPGTLLRGAAALASERTQDLRALDAAREQDPGWLLRPDMIGYSAYVDRLAGTLRGVADRVPYLQELGVRYLHLLPFQRARDGDNDGGFAVRDYDAIEPALGTIADLQVLTARLRQAGISLCADFVLNHTADDHAWAAGARAGDARLRDYYLVFPGVKETARFESTLGQVFPQTAPGNFTGVQGLGRVWTTFYPYQWDLNWANPSVFADMALTLLRMANRGVEAFRLDSTAYLWKRQGTACMNLPEAHAILQALRALVDLVAPGTLLKAEAIVPTRELPPYFGSGPAAGHECHLAYHSTLMAASWAALAEQRGDILAEVIDRTPVLPAGCAWVTYVRCHDDIGWNVLSAEAAGGRDRVPFDLAGVARFYAGETPGSYARGCSFQSTGAGHVHGTNGMAAALAGIETALASGDAGALRLAERRLLLLYGIAFTIPGVPLIYMGDEIALGNDDAYRNNPATAGEGRWLHRPPMDWAGAEGRRGEGSGGGATRSRIRTAMRRMIAIRRSFAVLGADSPVQALRMEDPSLFAIARGKSFVGVFNMGERECRIDALPGRSASPWHDLLGGADLQFPLDLPPHGMAWLLQA